MKTRLAAVVLCAGKGTRMKSERAKVLHRLLGRPMAFYPVSRAFELGCEKVVAVVGHQADQVQSALSDELPDRTVDFALQEEQRGTGHAVACAREQLQEFKGAVLILYGDVPLIRTETLQALVKAYEKNTAPLALISCRPADPAGYGRVVREGLHVKRIVEHKDATPDEREISEVNAGLYVVDAKFLFDSVKRLEPKNVQGELYLTDLVAWAAEKGEVQVVEADPTETQGINDRAELAERGRALQLRVNHFHMKNGVTLVRPETVMIDEGVEIGPDSSLGPEVTVSGKSVIGKNVRVGQGCVLTDSVVGDGTELKPYSVLEDARVGFDCVIGPFARLRPGTVLDEQVHLGNFVETKKTHLGKGSKANHLSYLGDATVGQKCNIGAGTITCNYDGYDKLPTRLGDGVFIGSDTQLVAPVSVGDKAYVGAGSTIVDDVPAGALALSRSNQVVKEGWVEKMEKARAGRPKGPKK
jgi:bifunctional UDP-N-acetylglucosamine pyrophosphorylase/glucosamine-1-phosphate N-acetyltransferase